MDGVDPKRQHQLCGQPGGADEPASRRRDHDVCGEIAVLGGRGDPLLDASKRTPPRKRAPARSSAARASAGSGS